MGSLISRNGVLYLDFRFKNQRCREVTRLPDTPANRKKCTAFLQRIDAEITLGSFDYAAYFPEGGKIELFRNLAKRTASAKSGIPTFGEFSRIWFAERQPEWRASYQTSIEAALNIYLRPTFGSKACDLIMKADILGFRAKLIAESGDSERQPLSPSRINQVMMVLRSILVEASERYAFDHPWKGIKRLKEPKSEVDPFTLAEVKRILDKVRPDMRDYYVVRFFTGMRSSEIDGLRWHNVRMDRREILVREALVQGKLGPTKTPESNRTIEMNGYVLAAFERLATRKHRDSDFVFSTRAGTPLLNRNVTKRVWYPTLRHLGLRQRKPYQTRHTAATLWLASGENPEWIARQMGHVDTTMLFTVYSRFVPNLTRRDGSAFEQLLANSFDQNEPIRP